MQRLAREQAQIQQAATALVSKQVSLYAIRICGPDTGLICRECRAFILFRNYDVRDGRCAVTRYVSGGRPSCATNP